MKFCYLDFEFNRTQEARLNLVSLSFLCTEDHRPKAKKTIWLYRDEEAKIKARAYLSKVRDSGYTFVAYAAEAEIRAMIALGFSQAELIALPVIDLYCEYRCLLNNNNELAYGKQLIDGKVRRTSPLPKWSTPEPNKDYSKPSYSLASACFKLLNLTIDTDEKNAVRDLIISDDEIAISRQKDRILEYNESDIKYLPELLNRIFQRFRSLGVTRRSWIAGAYSRGEYAVHTAIMVTKGYPVNMAKVRKFTANLHNILASAQEEVNTHKPVFVWNKKQEKYVGKENAIREWISAQNFPNWKMTDKGRLSLSKEAFERWFDSTSEGFGGAYYKFLKTKQSLNGFSVGKTRKNFYDYVGSDDRARPHFGIYGSQTSRSQPAATGFLALKAHWMRNFIEPKPGRAICEIDYASQEFLIAGILSQDEKMIRAYESGDPYIAFGKQSKLLPREATKQSHKKERDKIKTLVLGMSYDMGAKSMAKRMGCSEDEAQKFIDLFYKVYNKYYQWKQDILDEYRANEFLRSADHWYMFGDNDNNKSITNFPVQCHGAVVMREAVKLAHKLGIHVIFTLHDALYIEYPSGELETITKLRKAMEEAFLSSFKGLRNISILSCIRTEGCAWSKDYATKLPTMTDIEFMPEYIDAKGRADYERYSPYFT